MNHRLPALRASIAAAALALLVLASPAAASEAQPAPPAAASASSTGDDPSTSAVYLGPRKTGWYKGVRVCGVYNSGADGGIGTGLAVKVRKGANATCDQKIKFMKDYYSRAYWGSSGEISYSMMTCEEFNARVDDQGGDACKLMDSINGIYKVGTRHDVQHPQFLSVEFWHW